MPPRSMFVNPPESTYRDGYTATRVPPTPSHPRDTNPFSFTNPFVMRNAESILGNRKVRPSQFQKAVKTYDGLGDPHNHLARVRQFARAKNVRDYTQL